MTQAARDMTVVSFSKEQQTQQSVGEALKEKKNAKYLTADNGMAREITRDMSEDIQHSLYQHAAEKAKEHGLFVSYVMDTFTDEATFQQDVTMKFSASHPLGYDRFAADLIEGKGAKHKFKPEYYGMLFFKHGIEHVIKGIDTEGSSGKPQVILGIPDGNIAAPAKDVHKWLKAKGII